MELSEAASAIALGARLEVYFVYHDWMEGDDIPWDVTLVRVDSSVRATKDRKFYQRHRLVIVILNDRLEEMGGGGILLVLKATMYTDTQLRQED